MYSAPRTNITSVTFVWLNNFTPSISCKGKNNFCGSFWFGSHYRVAFITIVLIFKAHFSLVRYVIEIPCLLHIVYFLRITVSILGKWITKSDTSNNNRNGSIEGRKKASLMTHKTIQNGNISKFGELILWKSYLADEKNLLENSSRAG